jgi:hypothetical protein
MFQNVTKFEISNVLEMIVRHCDENQLNSIDILAMTEFRNFDLPESECPLAGHKSDHYPP